MALTVSVVIVSYNTRDLLRRALRSVAARDGDLMSDGEDRLSVEWLVIDNASHDGSGDMVASEFPGVVLVRESENRGFAAAANRGIERARGEYLLLLNPDAELVGDALERMVAFLGRHPSVGAVGPRLEHGDGTRQHAAFAFPTLPMVALEFFPLHHRLLDSRLNGRYPPASLPHPVGHLLGACMLLRRQAVAGVGAFDERFFMYCEEVDWCLRAWRCGWQVYHLPQAVARHLGGRSTGQRRDAMFVELHRSRLRLYRKHYPWLFRLPAMVLMRLGLWAEGRGARRQAAVGHLSSAALAQRLEAIGLVRQAIRTES